MSRPSVLQRASFDLLNLMRTARGLGVRTIQSTPFLAPVFRAAFEQRPGSCWGVFRTFEEAAAAAPRSKPLGYDHEGAKNLYADLLARVEPKDYAVAFWLQQRLQPGGRVFDFGGNVGTKYYALREILPFLTDVEWTVCDVPAVVAEGRKLAIERGCKNLLFTESIAECSAADVFLALGSLQYLESSLGELLGDLPSPPRYVVVSSTPMWSRERFVTLQNIGASYCPYVVEDRRRVVEEMKTLGYSLVREWENAEKSCIVIGRTDYSIRGYTSMHFARN